MNWHHSIQRFMKMFADKTDAIKSQFQKIKLLKKYFVMNKGKDFVVHVHIYMSSENICRQETNKKKTTSK